MLQQHHGQAGQLAQRPSMTSLQQEQKQQQDGEARPAQSSVAAFSELIRLLCRISVDLAQEGSRLACICNQLMALWLKCVIALAEDFDWAEKWRQMIAPFASLLSAPLQSWALVKRPGLGRFAFAASEAFAAQSLQRQSPEIPGSEGRHWHTSAQKSPQYHCSNQSSYKHSQQQY